MKTKKLRALIIVSIILIIILIQFIPVNRSNPESTAVYDDRSDVMAVLIRCCYDCHSNETVWPWYSRIAPVSWVIANHVHEGREHLNFSEWKLMTDDVKAHAARECWEEVEEGEMPLAMHLLFHPDNQVGVNEMVVLKNWAASFSTQTAPGDSIEEKNDIDDDEGEIEENDDDDERD